MFYTPSPLITLQDKWASLMEDIKEERKYYIMLPQIKIILHISHQELCKQDGLMENP